MFTCVILCGCVLLGNSRLEWLGLWFAFAVWFLWFWLCLADGFVVSFVCWLVFLFGFCLDLCLRFCCLCGFVCVCYLRCFVLATAFDGVNSVAWFLYAYLSDRCCLFVCDTCGVLVYLCWLAAFDLLIVVVAIAFVVLLIVILMRLFVICMFLSLLFAWVVCVVWVVLFAAYCRMFCYCLVFWGWC